jgi:ParB-like chromosome segregation protein Spo0J
MQFNCAYTELVSISKLVPNPKNANKHPPEQIERLAKIIDFQGQRSPVVVSKRSGFITKGHGRLMAMQKLKWEQVAVDYQDYLSEAQEYADVVADNEIARWAELDKEKMYTDLQDIDLGDIELLGLESFDLKVDKDSEEFKIDSLEEYNLLIVLDNEEAQSSLFSELQERGLSCKII